MGVVWWAWQDGGGGGHSNQNSASITSENCEEAQAHTSPGANGFLCITLFSHLQNLWVWRDCPCQPSGSTAQTPEIGQPAFQSLSDQARCQATRDHANSPQPQNESS